MTNARIGHQLYLFRREASVDLFAVLDQIARLGYDGVEFCGLFGQDAASVRKHLDRLGLRAIGNHVSIEALETGLDAVLDECRALGCETITLGWLPEERRHTGVDFARTADSVRRAAEACREAGLPLSYHNHNFEFAPALGPNGLTALLDAAPALAPQFDAGWLAIAGQDPLTWLRQYAGRYVSVHLKDYLSTDGAGSHDFCPIGMGVLDYRAIVEQAVRGGARWLIVDQDDDARRPPAEAARLSLEFLKSMGN